MSTYRRWWQAVLAAFLLMLIVTAWIIFAPLQVGGQAAYVIVTGNSMEPGFHLGDLVIVHQVLDYQIGDIVVYRSAELKGFVFHRIIGKNLDHYIVKGDNNSWSDSYQPTREELVGKLWIYIPNAGKAVQWLRLPINMALMAGVAGGILVTAVLLGRSKRERGKRKKSGLEWFDIMKKRSFRDLVASLVHRAPLKKLRAKKTNTIVPRTEGPAPFRGQETRSWSGIIEGLFFVLGLLAFASLVLDVFAFTRPVWLDVADNVNYKQMGTFSYTSTAPAGVYDTTVVTSGDPLFPKLTCIVNLQFTYTLLGNQVQGVAGTHQLTATILDDLSGWQRSLPLETQTSFSGSTFVTTTNLDLCQVEAIVTAMEDATGLHQSNYSLSINPRVVITGIMSGRGLQTAFEPHLLFLFDKVHFYLYKSDAVTDPLNSLQAGVIEGTRRQANTLSLLVLKPEVGKTRVFSLIGLGFSLCGLLFLGFYISQKVRGSQEALVQMKYSSMLVDIHESNLDLSTPAINVVTMDDLAKLAERHNSLILHETRGLTHQYLVQGDRITYRYILDESGSTLPEVLSMQQLKENLQKGIERGEFQVYYQPIVSLADGKITTVEALLRWQYPERGLVSAAEFIAVAEKTGLIDRIGEWMLQVACTQFEEWQKTGIQIGLAINLSESQLERDPSEIISRVLKNTGVDPRTLQIEISEASIMKNVSTVLPGLQKLTDLGLQLSVDNIAGQSSLSALEQFPIKNVKIDRLVVGKISNPENAITIDAMIKEGISMGFNVIAEGVETEEQLEFLRSHRCTLAQGYLLGRPAPAEEVTLLLQKGRIPDRPKPAKRRSRSKEDSG